MATKPTNTTSLTPRVETAPWDNRYKIGKDDPPQPVEKGFGPWKSKGVTKWKKLQRDRLATNMPFVAQRLGYNAALGLKHYMDNNGTDHWIDLESMVATVPSAKGEFLREVDDAVKFVESLSVGTYDICAINSRECEILQSEGWNWFFAVAGYRAWGKGHVVVRPGSRMYPNELEYSLDFEYKIFDEYNWHEYKSADIGYLLNIPDRWLGEFHLQGMAMEYVTRGSLHRNFKWKKNHSIPSNQFASIPRRG